VGYVGDRILVKWKKKPRKAACTEACKWKRQREIVKQVQETPSGSWWLVWRCEVEEVK
jgi:hypothetical protein